MKNLKKLISVLLTVCMMMGITSSYNVSAQVIDEIDNVAKSSESIIYEELQPCRASVLDQYSNRYFNTLAAAKKYYGTDWIYTACEAFYQAPGCYGGYWSYGEPTLIIIRLQMELVAICI